MSVVVVVLTIAGLSFNLLSQHHFEVLDRQALVEKLESTKKIFNNVRSSANLAEELPQLRALLGAHHDLAATILSEDGRVLFSDPKTVDVPESYRDAEQQNMWEWKYAGRLYRGLTARISVADQPEPLTALLILDVTNHAHFFQTLQRWFGVGLSVSALISAALGWMVVRSGLRPLRQVTHLAASMSARSLQERMPLEPIPLELQRLVLSFNAMLDRLEDAFVRLSNFSADIAHELRTPVSNLMTHTEVVLTKKRNIDAYEENLYSNLEELKRMSRIIDDMLFLAKSDNGLIIPEQASIELADVVAKLLAYYHLVADERDIRLSVSGAGNVLGDKLMIDRAVSNLLSNALRYTPVGETISVTIHEAERTVTLSVENPGGTIEPEHLDKLFYRFYRVDPARREGSPSNAGLGLAITRSIVEAHKGRIWCTSLDGVTGFHMEFPRQ